jgi:Skp family chaperone for outer membrane proteins
LKNIIFYKYFIISFLFICNSVYASQSVRFVDLDYIFYSSKAGKEITKLINEKSNNLASVYKTNESKIENFKNKLITQKNVLSNDEYNKQVKSNEKEIINFNNEMNKMNEDLKLLQEKSKNKFLEQVNLILSSYAKSNSIDIILNSNSIILGQNILDITDEILVEFDKNVETLN